MQTKAICTVLLAGTAMLGATVMQAQGTDQDKQFIMTASQSDLTEITLSKLALSKTMNSKVKAYAEKMIRDHTKLEADMKPYADKMGVPPATALNDEHQQLLTQLQGLSGADFDKQYMSDMDTSHHATLDAFKSELSTTTDAQLKPTVRKGERVVAQHTELADKLSKQLGGTTAGM